MAGFAMMGINYEEGGTGVYNVSFISEYRGHSYAVGGDKGAQTLATFIENYSPDVKGASVLSHFTSYCTANNCNFPDNAYTPLSDNLNAAKSGGMAVTLDFQLDYLIQRMKSYFFGLSFKNDWKMITLNIGSNDQCAACKSAIMDKTTPEVYGAYVEAAIERIQKEIPNVVVNLHCSCSNSPKNWAKMDDLSDKYNEQLQAIANKYKGKKGGTFAVMYSPTPVDFSSFPLSALSNIDCFHPNLMGHRWIAKAVWNQLYTSASEKPNTLTFDETLKIRCPESFERLPTT
ncbi:unnamed protein product [Mucor hiemalis]